MSKRSQRIVLKFGSGILSTEKGLGLSRPQIARLAREVGALVRAGHQCVIVSSGAVAAGLAALDLTARPKELAAKQACAAVGQSQLMHAYASEFAKQDIAVAQLLLTHNDLDSRVRHHNARNTLAHLLSRGHVVPIINENDSVAVEELNFGDNDRLSAEVAILIDADLLIILTSVDGLQDTAGQDRAARARFQRGLRSRPLGQGPRLHRRHGHEAPGRAARREGRHPGQHRQRPQGRARLPDRRRAARRDALSGQVGAMADLAQLIAQLGQQARAAARSLALAPATQIDAALNAMADELVSAQTQMDLLNANAADVAAARANHQTPALLDRLTLTPERIAKCADGLREVAKLPHPLGEVLREWTQPNGLKFAKVRVPLGVIGFIYESRPNVTVDAAGLCLKSGNAVILRGGSEALRSNTVLAAALSRGLARARLPAHAVQLVPVTDRDTVRLLGESVGVIDLLIPRGGKGLIETVVKFARIPVIKHYDGICAVYVDKAADLAMAEDIILNAKVSRPGVCNAAETLIVHRDVADQFLPAAGKALAALGVKLRAETRALDLLQQVGVPATAATKDDFKTEFLDLVLAVKVVDDCAAAIAHIEAHGSHHTDTIVTTDPATAEQFLAGVDSAVVLWNASTRFNDGHEFGFGAEIGISTDKLHARGPMGLAELTSYKYIIRGSGHIR
jgi:glutamate-5-semialdehyde dehydrogenase